jgi:2Fe-2S ferredoxin
LHLVKISVEPSGVEFDIRAEETVIQAAWRNGYTWPTICGGAGTCKTCVFMIMEGADNMCPIEPWEDEGLRSIATTLPANRGLGWRLACQAKVSGDVRLRKAGVRRQHDGG